MNLESVRLRASRSLGEHQVAQVLKKVKAIIGPTNIPDSDQLAQSAFDKLRNGEVPTPEELTALEVVIRLLRPVVPSIAGALEDLPNDAAHNLYSKELRDAWSGFRTRIAPLLYSIGRIESAAGIHIGTGFLVADGLVATNRHVLGVLTLGSEVLAPNSARVVFKQESGSTNPPEHIVGVDGVAAVHPTYDISLLRVKKLGRPLPELECTLPLDGSLLATIGYPAEDPANNPLFLVGVFQKKFGTKCAALGEVLDGTGEPALFHDCSTTQGNSGSPIFALESGRVVGIHRSGFFMYRNEAVSATELSQFVGNASI